MPGQKKRGTMTPRGPNKWLLRIYLQKDAAGVRKYASKVFNGTTSQARQALTQMLRENDTHTFVASSTKTVAAYLEEWLASKIDVSARSLDSYRRLLVPSAKAMKRGKNPPKRRGQTAIEAFGGVRLTDLTESHVQRWINEQVTRGISPRTIEYGVRVLSQAMNDARRRSLIVRNPAEFVKLPRKLKRPPSVLSAEQMRHLLASTATDEFGPLWAFLIGTGSRPQEALALAWEDVDLDGGWVSIRRVVVDDGHGHQSIEERAKADSQRKLGLAPITVTALRRHRTAQAAQILAAGRLYERNGLVFANRRGRMLDHNRVRKHWKSTLARLKLPEGIRLYDTRHSHLTALLASGADLAWVAARAGHADVKMTRDHYAHVLPETHRQMGEMTDRILGGAL